MKKRGKLRFCKKQKKNKKVGNCITEKITLQKTIQIQLQLQKIQLQKKQVLIL